MNFKDILYIYSIGNIGYMFIEILWRGYTHWSMGIAGGLSFTFMYFLENSMSKRSIFLKAFYSAICVTAIEFVIGLIVNRFFNLGVWDYSEMKYNLLGQISLLYSLFWYFLCIPALLLCRIIRRRILGVLPRSSRHLTKIFER